MSSENLCTEHEAISISGVSSRTLLRFSEAGYLTLHSAHDGSRMYERGQVEEIFGVTRASSDASDGNESNNLSDISAEHSCVVQSAPLMVLEGTQPSQEEVATQTHEAGIQHSIPLTDPDRLSGSGDKRDMEEIARLRNLLSLQERILDSKDDEIADLRNQRAWLRERIEKLEEKSDRDQILLLSETQTIRSLLAYQESRKSTFRQFLEWAGLYRNPPGGALPASGEYHSQPASSGSSSRTIEVSKAANSD